MQFAEKASYNNPLLGLGGPGRSYHKCATPLHPKQRTALGDRERLQVFLQGKPPDKCVLRGARRPRGAANHRCGRVQASEPVMMRIAAD